MNDIKEMVWITKKFGIFPTKEQFRQLAKNLQQDEPNLYKTYSNALDGVASKFGFRKYQAIKSNIKDVCRWIYNRDVDKKTFYSSSCCFDISLVNDNVEESNIIFCPKCGKRIIKHYTHDLLFKIKYKNIFTIYFDNQHLNKITIQTSLEKDTLLLEYFYIIKMTKEAGLDLDYSAREIIECIKQKYKNIETVDYEVISSYKHTLYYEDIYAYKICNINCTNKKSKEISIPLPLLSFLMKESSHNSFIVTGGTGVGKSYLFNELKRRFNKDFLFINLIEDFSVSKKNPLIIENLKKRILNSNFKTVLIDEVSLIKEQKTEIDLLKLKLQNKGIKLVVFSLEETFGSIGIEDLVMSVAKKTNICYR